jgi:hypothetical protein
MEEVAEMELMVAMRPFVSSLHALLVLLQLVVEVAELHQPHCH